jgi:nicotinamidase-related amidase
LKAEKKNTILFAGVNTDQCVLGTLVDGYNAGWNCVLVDDCCATTTEGGKEVSFHNISVSRDDPRRIHGPDY